MPHILHVIGARPNFMKVAPVISALQEYHDFNQTLIHTGQHYDANMSDIFFDQLGLPKPDINLNVGSASHAVQTAEIMVKCERTFLEQKPDMVLVYGDINSTVAAALVCAKLQISVSHVEAGLRSFDRTMPEEVNRLITDQLSDLLFTPSEDANENLRNEGIAAHKIHLVGNVMIDTLVRLLPQAHDHWNKYWGHLGAKQYGLVTLHRPSNVDEPNQLKDLLTVLNKINKMIPLIFPVHPRTRKYINDYNLGHLVRNLQLIDPLGYIEFLALEQYAAIVVTDSGGVQEETTYLGVPCLTMRENTERPVTVKLGTNKLIGKDIGLLEDQITQILAAPQHQSTKPPLWDGQASKRIAAVVVNMHL